MEVNQGVLELTKAEESLGLDEDGADVAFVLLQHVLRRVERRRPVAHHQVAAAKGQPCGLGVKGQKGYISSAELRLLNRDC